MGTAFDDSAFTDKVDLVAFLNCAETMSDGDCRSSLGSTIESVLHHTLAVAVQRGSSLV
jgi:hypothetical protein